MHPIVRLEWLQNGVWQTIGWDADNPKSVQELRAHGKALAKDGGQYRLTTADLNEFGRFKVLEVLSQHRVRIFLTYLERGMTERTPYKWKCECVCNWMALSWSWSRAHDLKTSGQTLDEWVAEQGGLPEGGALHMALDHLGLPGGTPAAVHLGVLNTPGPTLTTERETRP